MINNMINAVKSTLTKDKISKESKEVIEKPVELHRLHVTIRNKKLKPLKGFYLNIEKTESEVDLEQVVKYKLITEWYVWAVNEEIFNSFISSIKWEWNIIEKAEEKVKEFDKKFNLLVTKK